MPTLTLDGDAKGAVKAASDTAAAVDKIKKSFSEAGREAAELERAAKRIVSENETAQERYNRKMDELNKLFVAGKINVEQMDRAISSYGKQLDQATDASQKHGKAHHEAFGSESLHELVNMAAGVITLEKAYEAVAESIREVYEERKKAAEQIEESLLPAGQLSAVGGTKHDLERAREIAGSGITNESSAIQAVTGMVKAGLSDTEKNYLGNLLEHKLIEPGNVGTFAENVQGFRKAFPDSGSFIDTSKKIRSAAFDTLGHLSPEDMAAAMMKSGDAASENGFGADQALATVTAIAQKLVGARKIVGKAEKIFSGEGELDSASAAFASGEITKIQGAPGRPEVESLADTDPELASGMSIERSEAQLSAHLKRKYGTRTNLAAAVWKARTQRASEIGGTEPYAESLYQHTIGAVMPDETVLQREFLDHFSNVGPGETEAGISKYLGVPEGYWERQEKHLSRQTEIMEHSHRTLPPPSGVQE